MDLKNKKILVTGSDGFIGSHLVEELLQTGHKVRAFVYYNSFNSWGLLEDLSEELKSSVEVVAGDVRDAQFVKKALEGCDVVFHLAALISIPYSYQAAESFIDTNVRGTLNILNAAKDLSLKKVIHTSTSEVYGTAQTVPIAETHPINPQSPYAASKIGADYLALSYYYTHAVPVSIVRPFNTYGPRQSARAVIPTIITQIANAQKTIKLGSLSPIRDFCYVQDTVQGFIAAAKSDATVGEVINIGGRFELSIKELAELIAELMEVQIEIESDQARIRPDKSEVQRLSVDTTKAQKLMKWLPEYSGKDGFRRGLLKTIDWFNNQKKLDRYKPFICNI